MHSGRGDGPSRPPGYPIRKPPDHSLAAGSPGNIAGSSVLPRLLVPRHPPCALKNLAHNKLTYAEEPPTPKGRELQVLDARVHCAVLKKQTATPGHPPATGEQPRACKRNPDANARFLRTQQRAHREEAPPPPFRDPANGDA